MSNQEQKPVSQCQMSREQMLEKLKELILDLRHNTDKFRENPALCNTWIASQKEIAKEAKKLNSCDALWVMEEYGKWFDSEIKPNLPELDPTFKDRIMWR